MIPYENLLTYIVIITKNLQKKIPFAILCHIGSVAQLVRAGDS